MPFMFNQTQINEIQTLYTAALGATDAQRSTGELHTALYQYIFEQISDVDSNGNYIPKSTLTSEEQSAWLWVEGAIGVNSNDGEFFSDFIRDYTAEQYQIRYGQTLGDNDNDTIDDLQDASNDIAIAFAEDILNISQNGTINQNHELPPLSRIGEHDAGAVAATVFNGTDHGLTYSENYSGWAGTLLFPYLGNGAIGSETIEDSFTHQWLLIDDDPNDDRKALSGTYDLLAAVVASDNVSSVWDVIANRDELLETIQNNSIGETATEDLLEDLRNAGNTFFQNAYGLTDSESYRVGGDLPLYTPNELIDGISYLITPEYVLGSLFDDTNLTHTGTETAIIHAGLGDDTIFAKGNSELLASPSVIDGGNGDDTINYSDMPTTSNADRIFLVQHDLTDGLYSKYYTVTGLNSLPVFIDNVYGIENFIGTSNDDTFVLTVDDADDVTDLNTMSFDGVTGNDTFVFNGPVFDDVNSRILDSSGTVLLDWGNDPNSLQFLSSIETITPGRINRILADATINKTYTTDFASLAEGSFTVDYSGAAVSGADYFTIEIEQTHQGGSEYSYDHLVTADFLSSGATHTITGIQGYDDGTTQTQGGISLVGTNITTFWDIETDAVPSGLNLDLENLSEINIVTGTGNDHFEAAPNADPNLTNTTYKLNITYTGGRLDAYDFGSMDMADLTFTMGAGISASDVVLHYNGHDPFDTDTDQLIYWVNGTDPVNNPNTQVININGDDLTDFNLNFDDGSLYVHNDYIGDTEGEEIVATHEANSSTETLTINAGLGDDTVIAQGDGVGGGEFSGAFDFEVYLNDVGSSSGTDTLIARSGNVLMSGAGSTDHYRYESGNLEIRNAFTQDTLHIDIPGLTLGDLMIERGQFAPNSSGSDSAADELRITFSGHEGQIILNNAVTISGASATLLQTVGTISLLNGETLDLATYFSDWVNGSFGNDTLNGTTGADKLHGSDGQDTIYGDAGNDVINGGFAGDTLYGDAGDDVIRGGEGLDTIYDGAGDDILAGEENVDHYYVDITLGDADTIITDNTTSDRLFLENISAMSELYFWADGDDLMLQDIASGGTIRLVDGNLADPVESFTLLDSSTVIDHADFASHMTGAPPTTNIVTGTSGNDVYAVGFSDPDQEITEVDGFDAVQFGAGISASDITYTQSVNDLVITNTVTTQVVTIVNFFAATANEIEEVTFDDGTRHDLTFINQQINSQTGSSGNDTMTGGTTDDYLAGGDGADDLDGGAGDDVLDGGAGNDTLDGGAGNDVLDGTQGDDTLIGGTGHDVYYGDFGDTITENFNEGYDTFVTTDTSGSLTANNIRFTVFIGGAGHTIRGNDLANILIGSDAGSTLKGRDANDFLYDGDGVDHFVGNGGNDMAIFEGAYADYTITQTNSTSGSITNNRTGETDTQVNVERLKFADGTYHWSTDSFNTESYTAASMDHTFDYTNSGAELNEYDLYTNHNFSAQYDMMFTGDFGDVLLMQDLTLIDQKYYYEIDGDTYHKYQWGIFDILIDVNIALNPDSVVDALTRTGDDITGTAFDDWLVTGDGDDVLTGLGGVDTLTGGAGADRFDWNAGDLDGSVDTITDFNAAQGDVIDFVDILTGYDPLNDLIADFVQITDDGTDTTIAIDQDGTGSTNSFEDVLVVENTTGLDLNDMITNGELLVA